MYLHKKTERIFKSRKLERGYNKQVTEVLLNRLSTLELGPSNTSLSGIVSLIIYTYTFRLAQISRAGTWMLIPTVLKGWQAILNIENGDDFCIA